MKKLARSLYEQFVPESVRLTIAEYAKGLIAASGGILVIVNEVAPDYSDETRAIINGAIVVLTALGVVAKANRPRQV